MDKAAVVKSLLQGKREVSSHSATGFAPSNIALCKYWGKRDVALNLPTTTSLSISLGNKGAQTKISVSPQDELKVNGVCYPSESPFAKRTFQFLELFKTKEARYFRVETETNLPVASGLASSACGFAALVLALDGLFGWELPKQSLSILARLGSGSAARSLWPGFVEWQRGERADGSDSFAYPLSIKWPSLRVGLCILSDAEKQMSSRQAMQQTVETSYFYTTWKTHQEKALEKIKEALHTQNFTLLGEVTEANATALHALMLTAIPAILYSTPDTFAMISRIWNLRQKGIPLYFTQDAGPNLKFLFLEENQDLILKEFPMLEVIAPFGDFSWNK